MRTHIDPAPDQEATFECTACGKRVTGEDAGRSCSSCGGYLRNISVPRSK